MKIIVEFNMKSVVQPGSTINCNVIEIAISLSGLGLGLGLNPDARKCHLNHMAFAVSVRNNDSVIFGIVQP